MRVGRGNLGQMLTFWKAEGVPQWTVLVISVVPSLWKRKINICSSVEYLGVGIMVMCFLCAFHWGSSSRDGMAVGRGVKGRKRLPSSKAHLQHLCVKKLCKAIKFKSLCCQAILIPHKRIHLHAPYHFGCLQAWVCLGQAGSKSKACSRLSER